MDCVLHRPQGRLGVIPAMQVVTHAKFQNDALACHAPPPYATSSQTTAAALAIKVDPVPSSLEISNPPSTTLTVPVPCGSTASTASLSTFSGCGTPIVPSTCM